MESGETRPVCFQVPELLQKSGCHPCHNLKSSTEMLFPFCVVVTDPRANRGQEQLGGLPSDPPLCFSGHGCLYGLAQPLTYICIYLHRFACIQAVLRFLLFIWLCS